MKKINIAILSLNHGHAKGYYTFLQNCPFFNLVAVSVSEAAKGRIVMPMILKDVPKYDTDEALLEAHPEVEAVILASPNQRHLEQFQLCAQQGKHIMSMKIPTFQMDEYAQMIALVEKYNIVCQVEQELHYHATVRHLKELLDRGTIGKLLSIQAINYSHCPSWWLAWQADPDLSYGKRIRLREGAERFRGGALCDHPHIFDIVRYLTGSEFVSIYAELAPNLRSELEVEDMLSAVAKLEDGTIVSLDKTIARNENKMPLIGPGWEKDPKRVEVNLVICGEKGTLLADCFHHNIYHTGNPNHRFTVRYGNIREYWNMLYEFYDCIQKKKMPSINLYSHRKTIEAMNACYESIAKGAPVKL